MGESELVSQMMPHLPTGQAAYILVESVQKMVAALNRDMRQYHAGIMEHSEKLEEQQENIKNLVSPETWSLLKEPIEEVLAANTVMKKRVEEAETQLEIQEQQVSQLQQKTRLDPLTGALNRSAMDEDLTEEFARSKRYGRSFAIILADIDFFKNINDTYGHLTGDEVLKSFVKLLRKSLREVDLIYRYGGEEFVVMLPETEAEGAAIAAERVRKCVEGHTLRHRTDDAVKVKITISLGVTSFTEKDADFRDMIRRADEALYRAKNSGRNRVEMNRAA